MLRFKPALSRKLLPFKETTNFPEAEQVSVIWTCVIDSSSYRTLQNPVCYYSERTSGIHKDIGWQDCVLNESRERFIYRNKDTKQFNRNVASQLPGSTVYLVGRLQCLILTKTQHLKMKYDNNLNNSVTPEMLPTFEYYHVSYTVIEDTEFPAFVHRAWRVLDWMPISNGEFSWTS
jgi:hypothetical protein